MTTGVDFCLSLFKNIESFLDDGEIKNRYRQREKDFTRKKKLSFKSLIIFMLQYGKSSIQHELDEFFIDEKFTISKAAYSLQRKKVKYELFQDLNSLLVKEFYANKENVKTWKGYRILAIDGSTMQLPTSQELINKFGIFNTRTENNRKVVMARMSILYDVLNGVSITSELDNYFVGEIRIAEQQIDVLKPNDLLVADRGYSAFWFMSKIHHHKKAKFAVRLKANRWKMGKDFLASGLDSQIVEMKPSKEAKKKCKEKKISYQSFQVRLIRVRLKDGESHVIVTNLLDNELYTVADFKGLYHYRWSAEENYKHLKQRGALENMSGKSVLSVLQDFHRIILRSNVSQLSGENLIAKEVKKINKRRKKTYQLNRTQAYRKTKNLFNLLFQIQKTKWKKTIGKIKKQLIQQLEIVRRDRSNPVLIRYGGRPINFMAYKP
ncbi:MAG: IS4 family transposase [Paracoccaceae bacterium]